FSVGQPVRRFSHAYLNYTYEVIDVSISDDLLASNGSSSSSSSQASDSTPATPSSSNAGLPLFNPYLDSGRHIDSRIMPTFVFNTVDNPITAHSGRRVTASVQVAGELLRGSYNYLKPELEAVMYFPTNRRTGFGLRGQAGLLRTYGTTATLPYYLR